MFPVKLFIFFGVLSTTIECGIIDSVTIKLVTDPIQHAEGPIWDHRNGVLYFVDTFKATLLRVDPKNHKVTSHKLDQRDSIAVALLVKGDTTEFLVGADRYIYTLKWDGLQNNTGIEEKLCQVDKDKPNNQFNDGKIDVNGNIWMGSLTRAPDLSVPDNGGALYQLINLQQPSAIITQAEISNTSISNGLAWSKDNKHFFFIDSKTRVIEKYDFDKENGSITNKKILFDLNDHGHIDSDCIADGMTIDSNDNLWVALLGGSAVIQIDSFSGDLLRTVDMPAKYITSAIFGGPNMDVLYVTTSRLKVKPSEIEDLPFDGSVFEINGLGVKGLPSYEALL